jgi:menaquinone-dependent protoporphyrinogen oxidase
MTTDVLIVYASKRGSTEQVARRVGEVLRSRGLTTSIQPASEVKELSGIRAVVVGGSIYTGRWNRQARTFLRRHRRELEHLPLAVFALGPGEDTPERFIESEHQLAHALEQHPGVEPQTTAVFGGVIDPEKLHFPFNRMEKRDLRDWDQIHAWALTLPTELNLEPSNQHLVGSTS